MNRVPDIIAIEKETHIRYLIVSMLFIASYPSGGSHTSIQLEVDPPSELKDPAMRPSRCRINLTKCRVRLDTVLERRTGVDAIELGAV